MRLGAAVRASMLVFSMGAAMITSGCGAARRGPGSHEPLPADAYQHYVRGRIAVFEGHYPEAVDELRKAAQAAPDEALIQVALIQALQRAGRRAEARRMAEAAQRHWPDEAAVWLASGDIYKAEGRTTGPLARHELERALAAYERARKLAPASEEPYLGLAATHVALQEPARAEAAYQALVQRVPTSIAGHHGLAWRLFQRKAFARAEIHFRQVLELQPEHIQARVALARTLRARGRARESTETLRQAFDRSGGDPGVGEELFHQLLDAGERDDALTLLTFLDRDDLDEEVKISFGYLYLELGEHEAALAWADRLLVRWPQSAPARILKATALADARQLEQAVAILLEITPDAPVYPYSRAFAAELLARTRDLARATELIERATASHPGSIELLIGRARIEELSGRAERARALFRAALTEHPDSLDLLYAYGVFEDRQGNAGQARALVQKILDRDSENATALNFIGFSLAHSKVDLARAEVLLERALELSPGNPFILDSYGWLLFRQNRLDQARATLERAVHLVRRDPELLWHLGEVLLAQGKRLEAMSRFEEARGLGPDPDLRARIEARINALSAHK